MCSTGQVRSIRKLVWVEGQPIQGCSECPWTFKPLSPPIGKSLDEMMRNFKVELSNEFASHVCAKGDHD
jgi:hypothetical protein